MKVNEAVLLINDSDSIALIAHIKPDGDALGSCMALKHALEIIGKKVDVYCQDPVPHIFSFLEGIQAIKIPTEPIKQYDVVIAIDCSDKERLGDVCGMLFDKAAKTINIDHHVSNTEYADINIVDSEASATGELIYELIISLGVKPEKTIAEALYTAITTDTGSFCYSNTTSRTHYIAAKLLECGIEVDRLSTILFKQHTVAWTRLLGKALGTLELHLEGKVALIQITREMIEDVGAGEGDTSGIINYAKDIEGVEVAIMLKEEEDSVKVGLRSQFLIDVSQIAGQFGGGGHVRAAGCKIEASLEEARDIILKAVKEEFSAL